LLGSVTVGRSDEVYQQSARISEKILKENPNHPGALHYFIHANDDPYHASTAVQVANEYAVVAPDAAHALHMPTHIYLALGMWDKVVSSNEVSWQASVNRKERKNLGNDAYGYHSYHWLQYGYLQQGRVEDGRIALENMIAYCTATAFCVVPAPTKFFLNQPFLQKQVTGTQCWPQKKPTQKI
jgi:hypothetical protein